MSDETHRVFVWPDGYGETIGAGCTCGWSVQFGEHRFERIFDDEFNVGVPIDLIVAAHDRWLTS